MMLCKPKKPDDSFEEIPILEGEECWAMRVIDEHQNLQSSIFNSEPPSSETPLCPT
jgi:hypothetical protein